HSHVGHDHSHPHGDYENTRSHGGHAHSHLPPGADGSKAGLRSLLAIGISGGLVPCPAALVLLLSAISLGRLGFGMVLVVVFSMGLAVVLTGIGLLMVYARRLFERCTFEARIPRFLPVVSAAAISLVGFAILLGAISQIGVV
ncbi:MAG: sulfite exporter TauE/SafE family protein, partial [Rubrobacteraceae bacterium]|nr:sulfite exporter TauE/SafE family protein [Rubrobacteraceae bacterium]